MGTLTAICARALASPIPPPRIASVTLTARANIGAARASQSASCFACRQAQSRYPGAANQPDGQIT
jgi:hypothetical protein